MKAIVSAFLLCAAACNVHAASPDIRRTSVIEGTLTLTINAVVFASAVQTNEFRFGTPAFFGPNKDLTPDIPGLQLVKFEPKWKEEQNKRVDCSVLTVNNAEGESFALARDIPVRMYRIEILFHGLKEPAVIWRMCPTSRVDGTR